jgi:cobalt-zinc-cadmium resistance protein CzcA
MLNALIDWSLRNRFLVLIGVAIFACAGLYALPELPIDAFPDTTPVQVQINTTAPGLAPVQVEKQITFPVEQAISGLPRLTQVRSLSRFGLSQVTVVFADGTDIYFARQQVNERLNAVELPEGIGRPKMGPISTGLGEVYHYLVRDRDPKKETDPMRLRTVQDWVIRPSMRTVSGSAEINSWGGLERQYQVRIDPKRLLEYDLTFDQVTEAVRKSNLDVGGGYIEQSGASYLVRGLGRTNDVASIRRIVVATPRDGVPITVGDVAEVAIGHDLPSGGVTADGKGEVVLGLGFMLMGENSHDVTSRFKDKMTKVKKSVPADVEVAPVYDRTELVDLVIATVRSNLFEGGLLVVAVLFLFLGNLRAGLIVALAIPLSMLFAFSGMLRFGIAGSLLSLGAIDFGLVVDSSVVMIENCVRHMAHPSNADMRKSQLAIVRDAAVEVRGPTLFGELIILIVYLPVLTLEGVAGKMFRPMALTVIFALLGSMVLSLTLMPVLASLLLGVKFPRWLLWALLAALAALAWWLLPWGLAPAPTVVLVGRWIMVVLLVLLIVLLLPARIQDQDPWLVRLLRFAYRPVLRLALRNGLAVLVGACAVLLFGVLVFRSLGWEFVPRLNEGSFVLSIMRLPDTSIEEAMRRNSGMEKMLLEEFPDEVEHVWSRCGTAEVATDPMGPEETDMFITLKPRDQWTKAKTQDELKKQIRQLFEPLPGQKVTIDQPINQRTDEMTSGVRAAVAVKIFGDDYAVLLDKAEDIEKILKATRGSKDVTIEQVTGLPVLDVKLQQEELARYGLSSRMVLERIEALGGKPVGDVLVGALRFPLAVRLPRGMRRDPAAFANLLITAPSGEQVPLSRLAEVKRVEGPSKVLREWGQRLVVVKCNIEDRDTEGFVQEARQRIVREIEPELPPRYRIEFGGQFEYLQKARQRLILVVPAALLLIAVLLYLSFRRIVDVVLVFITGVFFSSVGGVVALWLREMPLSVSAGVGFIALFGVSVLNSMVLATFIRQLVAHGTPMDQAIQAAALTRLRPVLMTALVASLGFVPMALSTGVGAEVQRPLATVVIGGVISSTALTLVVLPVLYHFFGPRRGEVQEENGLTVPPAEGITAIGH